MDFTKEQLSEVLCKHAERENGLQDLMEIMIESMMVAERREYLREDGLPGDKGNGFREGHTYGQGRTLTFRIPRDRYGNFHPRILAILRNQEEECERLAGTLYSKGLTQQSGSILSGPLHRLCTHKDPSQAQCGHGSVLCASGREGRQDERSDRHLQQAYGKRPRMG